MLKRLSIVSILCLLVPGFALAENVKDRLKGPITVTAETLTADNRAHTAFFEKNVTARTGDMTIYADTMLVFYTEDGGEVTKIEAAGSVKLSQGNRVITAQKATYFAKEERVVFTGDPRAVDGENMVTGSKITFYLREDRSVVENSKVYLKSGK